MILLQRRVFLELMGNAFVAVALLLAVLLLITSVTLVSQVEGLGAVEFLSAIPVFLAASSNVVLPLAVLVAVVMTYGRLAADNEVDAVRASGINPWSLLVPGLVFGALAGVLLLLALDYGEPYAKREQRRILRGTDVAAMLARRLATGEPVYVDEHTLVSAERIGEDGTARNLRIQFLDDGGSVIREVLAESAEIFVDIENSVFVVKLHEYRETKGGASSGRDLVIEHPISRATIDLGISQLTTPQLEAWLLRSPTERGIFRVSQVEVELGMRLPKAAACLVFVLLGMPVALRFRRSDRVGAFLVAFVLALFVYYPSVKISTALAKKEVVPVVAAAWSGNALLLLAGLLFSRRALRR